MTNRKPRSNRGGVGFSAPGLRKITELFVRQTGASPNGQPFVNIFGTAIAVSFTATGGGMGALSYGWAGLLIGALLGLALASLWLENDAFFG